MNTSPHPDVSGAFDALDAVVKALVLYTVAEAQAGHATRLHVAVAGRRFVVEDDGRGHSLSRTVDGVPYLQLVYEQLRFPFGRPTGPAVQLQGVAPSLVRAMCADLAVTVRRAGQAHRVVFADGSVHASDSVAAEGEHGNRIEGTLHASLPVSGDHGALRAWLQAVAASVPPLSLQFNDEVLAPGGPPRG